MDNATTKLADGVWRVQVGTGTNAYVLADDGHSDAEGLTLVDVGWRACAPRLVRSIRVAGMNPRAVRRIIVTHWHTDHAGAVARWVDSSAAPEVVAADPDAGVLEGADPPPAPTAPGRWTLSLSGRPPTVDAVTRVGDADVLPTAGGAHVITTPGHTPGHIALWLPERSVLLAGDAVFNVVRPSLGPRLVAHDRAARAKAVARLATLTPDVVAVGHGPPIDRNAAAVLTRLAHR